MAGVLTRASEALMKERCFERPTAALARLGKAWFLPVAGVGDTMRNRGPHSRRENSERKGVVVGLGFVFSSAKFTHSKNNYPRQPQTSQVTILPLDAWVTATATPRVAVAGKHTPLELTQPSSKPGCISGHPVWRPLG